VIVVSGGAAALQRIWNAEAALADRDLAAARRWADEAVSSTTGWWLTEALTAQNEVLICVKTDQGSQWQHLDGFERPR
jgi:hypothetical protein